MNREEFEPLSGTSKQFYGVARNVSEWSFEAAQATDDPFNDTELMSSFRMKPRPIVAYTCILVRGNHMAGSIRTAGARPI